MVTQVTELPTSPTSGQPPRSRPLRVLQVVEATLTGVGRHCLDLCRGLAERGCSIDLIYSPTRIDNGFKRLLADFEQHPLVHTVAHPMQRAIGMSDAMAAKFVRRHLKRHGPFDIVHGHSSKGGAIARLAAFGTGVPAVYTPNAIRTMNPQVGSRSRWVVGLIERLLARVPGQIIAVSREERDHIIELGISADKISLVPNGIDPMELPDAPTARHTLGLAQDVPVLGFVGRLSEQKAIDVLINAMPLVLKRMPDVQLALIGDGELVEELQQLAEDLGVAQSIHWLGQQPGFASMPAFDLFVLPSRYEGLPYVLIEALMASLPVVTTDLASSSMLVESSVNGCVVPAESPGELAEAILSILCDPDRKQQFAMEAAARGAAFTLDAMVDQTLAVYDQLLPTPGGRTNS